MTEPDAFQSEMLLISLYGRIDLGTGCLRNRTDGGEGLYGQVFSSEHRAKIGAFRKGRPRSKETKAKISSSMKGKSVRGKGWHLSEETITKRSATRKGKSYHGHPTSEMTKAKLSAANTGKKRSEESRARMSAAQRLHHLNHPVQLYRCNGKYAKRPI